MDALKIKKGLGRGLSSLIGDTKIDANINKLSISELVRNKFQPRKSFNQENLELISSNVDLSGLEVETAGDSKRAFLLKDQLMAYLNDSEAKYDYILID